MPIALFLVSLAAGLVAFLAALASGLGLVNALACVPFAGSAAALVLALTLLATGGPSETFRTQVRGANSEPEVIQAR